MSPFGTPFVTKLLDKAKNPERRFAAIELSAEVASWALEFHVNFDSTCTVLDRTSMWRLRRITSGFTGHEQ